VPRPPHDSVLLLAYGGPTRPEEIRPFLDNVLRGRPVPKERYEEVVGHYEKVGGASPIHRLTFEQAEGLRSLLESGRPALPVHVGMRFWHPSIAETLARMTEARLKRAVGIVLAPHPSHASREVYHQAVSEARQRVGAAAPEVDFVEPFGDHPDFIEAVSGRIRDAYQALARERRPGAALVLTAHSIPVEMSGASEYEAAIRRTAALASRAAGIGSWTLAWQSRSGRPGDRWLEPDINDAIRSLHARGVRDVVVAPIGFVSDHVEVLYDLDIQARATADGLEVGFHRAGTAGTHPAFLRMLAALVRAEVAGPGA
jgi:protoporphyrin/coproporphyrin ferrochelatase